MNITPFKKLIKDVFTAPDGETWAIGRLSGVGTLLYGYSLPIVEVIKGHALNFSELAVYMPAVAGGATALYALTNKMDNQPPTGGQ